MSKGVVFHWATHRAPVCACTLAQPKLRPARPSWVPLPWKTAMMEWASQAHHRHFCRPAG